MGFPDFTNPLRYLLFNGIAEMPVETVKSHVLLAYKQMFLSIVSELFLCRQVHSTLGKAKDEGVDYRLYKVLRSVPDENRQKQQDQEHRANDLCMLVEGQSWQ